MKKAALFLVSAIVLISLNSCSFFGEKKEKQAESKTSMAMEFVKQAKKAVKQLKEEKVEQIQKQTVEDAKNGETLVLTDKDFQAYLTSLDYAIKKLAKQNKEIEAKIKAGKLSAMDILAYSMNSFATVFNPDEYMDKIAETEEEKAHYEKAFGRIIQLFTYIQDKPVEEFKKENEESQKASQQEMEALKKKIEEIKKENPEAAKQMEEQFDFDALEKANKAMNPLNYFTENDFKLYSKYQKEICAKNNELKEEIQKLKKIFENFNKK